MGTGQLEDILLQAVPVEHNRISMSYVAYSRAHMEYGKTTMSDRGKTDHITPIKKSQEVSGRHIAYNDQLDCIKADNMLTNITMNSSQNIPTKVAQTL